MLRWMNAQIAFLLSALFHIAVFGVFVRLLPSTQAKRDVEAVKVRLTQAPQPVMAPTEPPRALLKPPAPVTPVRVDRRRPAPAEKQKPEVKPETRAGLSDSLALPGTARAEAPAVAVGNSSVVPVNPEDARKPPPPPLSSANEVEIGVVEAVVDTPARCPLPPSLELTTDALNAGLTNAEVVIEVAVSASGAVQDAKLKAGTGYEIDKIALRAALKLKCSPAVLSGKAIAVAGKKLVWKVMYD